ncbi:wee1-like protein kinase [Daktulosphaira vitifoliae]|uniref:wee1-like protein kinase n=1 Tax=Daktulosphaira vitifoliae TaxID=58002 RepID=UPI0021AA3ACA|nr:wee1-like protein kinase [Daktulosphaira vitifoliae]
MDGSDDQMVCDDESFFVQKMRRLSFDADKAAPVITACPPSPDGRHSFSPKIGVDSSTPFLKPRILYKVRHRGPSPPSDTSGEFSRCSKPRLSVNPFTPTGIEILKNKQRKKLSQTPNVSYNSGDDQNHDSSGSLSTPDSKTSSAVDPSIRDLMNEGEVTNVSIYDLQTSRFNEEFRMDDFIATGAFGEVYKCTNLLDGISYAIKKTKKTIYKSQEYFIRKEVYAHSVIGRHPNIVSYFTAWHERGHIYIQTEFCNGGTLERMIHESDHIFCDSALRRLLCHVCKGLAHIHSKKLAHLDIKAANILICRTDGALLFVEDLDDDETVDKDIVYKIGDFGHTICIEDVRTIEDGDCRYLPKELLRDDYSQLQKADVFSTALTAYEAATKKDLPKNGPEWHSLRDGGFCLPQTPVFSTGLEKMLKKMVDIDPTNRPTASTVVNLLLDRGMAAVKQQQDEIEVWKLSSKFLTPCYSVETQTPRTASIRRYENSKLFRTRKERIKRLVGRKMIRSCSTPNV